MRVCAFCRGGPVCPPQTRSSHIEWISGAGAPTRGESISKACINNRADTQVRPYRKPIPCFQGLFQQTPTGLLKKPLSKDHPPYPPLSGLLKKPEERGITPPLRGSRQDEGEARRRAGGGTCHGKAPPTASAFAQTARLLRLPLKGGVDLIFSLVRSDLRRGRIPAFSTAPCQGGMKNPLKQGMGFP